MSSTIRKRVRKSGQVTYQAMYFIGKSTFGGSKTFERRKDAVAWLNEKRKETEAGVDVRAAKAKTGDVLATWLNLLPGQLAESTTKYYRSVVRNHVPAWLADKRLQDVTSVDMQRALNEIKFSDSTKQRIRTVFMSFFTWCVDNKLLASSPMKGVKLPRANYSETRMNPFTWEELDQVVSCMRQRSELLSDVVLVLGYTGLRWGELRALRVRDVQETPIVRISVRASQSEGMQLKLPKSGKVRHVPVVKRVRPIVLAHIKGKNPDDLVFTTARGAMLNKGNFKRALEWKHLARGRRLHDLRHTAATEWLRHGVDILTVQEWLGHSSLTMTQRYVHYLGNDADLAALRKLDEA